MVPMAVWIPASTSSPECGEIRGWGREARSRDEFFLGVLSMPYAGSLNAGTV